jgi:hypothetical protein
MGIVLVVLQVGIAGQEAVPPTTRSLSSEAYTKVLDVIFPRDDITSSELAYSLFLRFSGGAGDERQITIRDRFRSPPEVEFVRVTNGSALQIAQDYVRRNGEGEIGTIKDLITTEKKRLSFTRHELDQIHASFVTALKDTMTILAREVKAFDKDGSSAFVLHGSTYEIWYSHLMIDTKLKVIDVAVDDAPKDAKLPLTGWVISLNKRVEEKAKVRSPIN